MSPARSEVEFFYQEAYGYRLKATYVSYGSQASVSSYWGMVLPFLTYEEQRKMFLDLETIRIGYLYNRDLPPGEYPMEVGVIDGVRFITSPYLHVPRRI